MRLKCSLMIHPLTNSRVNLHDTRDIKMKFPLQLSLTVLLLIFVLLALISCQTPPTFVGVSSVTPSIPTVLPTSDHMPLPRSDSTPVVSTSTEISTSILDEWQPANQCKYTLSPEWKHALAICSDAKDIPAGVYLAKWETSSDNWIGVLSRVDHPIRVSWSPDGETFTIGVRGAEIGVHKVETPKKSILLTNHWGNWSSWSFDGRFFGVLSEDPLRVGFFTKNGDEVFVLSEDKISLWPISSINVLKWLPHSDDFVMFDKPGEPTNLVLLDVATQKEKRILKNLPVSLFASDPSPDGRYIVLISHIAPTEKVYRIVNLETSELIELPSGVKCFSWSQDSRKCMGFERADEGRIKITTYDITTKKVSSFFLPEGTYHHNSADISWGYFELLGDYLYYRDSTVPDKPNALYRYNLSTKDVAIIIPSFPEWDLVHIVGRQGNRWLVQLQNEDEQWRVTKLKYMIIESEDGNLTGR